VCGRCWRVGEVSELQLSEHVDACLSASYLQGDA
jgi:hypothetical protein